MKNTTKKKLKFRQIINTAILAFFKKRNSEWKKVMRYRVNEAILNFHCNKKNEQLRELLHFARLLESKIDDRDLDINIRRNIMQEEAVRIEKLMKEINFIRENYEEDIRLMAEKDEDQKCELKEKIHYFEELFKNNSNVFATLKEEHVLEVEELTSTIISLKQRCKKLQYDSKQGNQTKKKKNAKEEYKNSQSKSIIEKFKF